jgi:hypothetical protein
LIIRLIIQTIRRDRSGSVWIDEASDVSRPDPTGADQIDVEHQVQIWRLGVRIPRGAHTPQVSGLEFEASLIWEVGAGRHSDQSASSAAQQIVL